MTVPDYSKISAHPVETDLVTEEAPWYRDIFSQLHDLWSSQRISPRPITARPVEIQELFHEYPLRSSSIVWSGLLHLLALGLLLYVPLRALQTLVPPQRIAPEVTILITGKSRLHLPPKAEKSGGGGGGGRETRGLHPLGGFREPQTVSSRPLCLKSRICIQFFL